MTEEGLRVELQYLWIKNIVTRNIWVNKRILTARFNMGGGHLTVEIV